MRFRRRSVLAAALIVLLAACSGGADTSTPSLPTIQLEDSTAVLAASVDRTNDLGSYQFDMLAEATVPGFDTPVKLRANGAVDPARGLARMTMDLSEMFDAFADQFGDEMLDEMFGETEMSMVVTPATAYLKFAPLSELLGGGAEWIEVPIDTVTAQTADMGFGIGDPTQLLGDLAGAGDAVELGPDVVQGIPATRFHVEFDLDSLGGDVGDLFSADVPLDVWIDDRGLILRVEGSYEALGVGAAFALEFHSFGLDADIEIPSGGNVTSVDISDFFG